jgi:PAS domain S-box-containing protein
MGESDQRREHGAAGRADGPGRAAELERLNARLRAELERHDRDARELAAREAGVRLLLDRIPAIVWTTDRDLRITSSAGAGAAPLGVRPESYVGTLLADLLPAEGPGSEPLDAMRRALRGESVAYDAAWAGRWFRSRVEPLYGPGAEAVGCIAITFDVTEQRRAEESLRRSEEFHRMIADLTSDYAYRCTVDADGVARLESVTGGFERVTGFSLAEVKARGDWASLIHPADLGLAERSAEGFRAGRRVVEELRIVTRAGRARWIRFTIHPVLAPGGGRVVELLGAVRDITEEKRAAGRLRRYARRLRALSRRLLLVQEEERRRLARELHDEVGQQLTGLKLTLEMAEGRPPEEARARVAEARGLVQQLMNEVRNISMGLRPAQLDDLGLRPALEWAVGRYAEQTGVRVRFTHRGLDRRFPPEVETAAYRIAQEALTNVARHAGVGEAALSAACAGGLLRVRVRDRGTGFDPGAAVLVGVGGGLAGMRQRAALLGGRLTVESRRGRGTRITAELPVPGDPGDGR